MNMEFGECFFDLLKAVTVDCKDDGTAFTVNDRVAVIERMLDGSSYVLAAREPLALLYSKRLPVAGDRVLLVSSHVDCLYERCFCSDEGECVRGTFDNAFGNAAILWCMLNDRLPDNVVVAFTGDEERDSRGALQALGALGKLGCSVSFALVQDVTNVGWENGALFAIENDLGVDILTAYAVVSSLEGYSGKFAFCHNALPDESWDYAECGVPSMSLCMPVGGELHGGEGVMLRKAAVPGYCDVLCTLAGLLAG